MARTLQQAPGDAIETEPVRTCADCRRAKTVRGVWYLVPGRAPLPFVCETCFAVSRTARALS